MKEKISILISFIGKQWETIEILHEKIKKTIIKNHMDEEHVVYAAYNIHNMYSAFEEIFKNVAGVFENQVNDKSKYHLELLKKMNIDIYKIRPAFLSDNSYKILNETRKFRHFFRHAYEYDLDRDKILLLVNLITENFNHIEKDKNTFIKFLIETLDREN